MKPTQINKNIQHHREAINCLRSCELRAMSLTQRIYLLICKIKLVTIDDADTKIFIIMEL